MKTWTAQRIPTFEQYLASRRGQEAMGGFVLVVFVLLAFMVLVAWSRIVERRRHDAEVSRMEEELAGDIAYTESRERLERGPRALRMVAPATYEEFNPLEEL